MTVEVVGNGPYDVDKRDGDLMRRIRLRYSFGFPRKILLLD